MKEFEQITKNIFHFLCEFGIINKPIDFSNIDNITQKDKQEFKIQVHKGFRIGQDLIVKEIIPLLKDQKRLKEEALEAKRRKDNDLLKQISHAKYLTDYKINILRHFADYIAWLIFKNNYYKARRFHSGSRNRPDLLNSNLESILMAVKYFHSQNQINFALISDLTSFIDIGDILLVNDEELAIIECKEGATQKSIYNFLNEIGNKNYDVKNIDYSNKNFKYFEQARRTIKQIERGHKLSEFLKNEAGADPFTESKIKVLESTKPPEYYFTYLIQLIEESKINNSSYGEIEESIFIGIYRENKIPISPILFKDIVKPIYKKYIVVDYINMITLPLKEPIFFKPFGIETIFDLMFGRLKIFLAINFEKLIELFNKKGIKARWLSRKETQKFNDNNALNESFTFEHRAIEIIVNNEAIILGDSFIIYLLFDNITPNSFIDQWINLKQGSP